MQTSTAIPNSHSDANVLAVELDAQVKSYMFWALMAILVVTVVGIPLIPICAILYWAWYAPRYNEYHSLELSATSIQSKRGVVFRSQTNVPLERITDVSVHQGPLMRRFGVYKVTIESAGQTQVQGAASVLGVKNPYDFRDAVMENVELLKVQQTAEASDVSPAGPVATPSSKDQTQLLMEIRDLLARIEARGR